MSKFRTEYLNYSSYQRLMQNVRLGKKVEAKLVVVVVVVVFMVAVVVVVVIVVGCKEA